MKSWFRNVFPFLFLAAIPSCCPSAPASAAKAPEARQRVVLVHGFMETGSTFRMLRQRLEKRGVDVMVAKLKHTDGTGGLEFLATHLKQDIDKQFGPEAPISIVAFSMGGLVSREYLQNQGGASRCENLITVSSPHNGTKAAFCYPSKGVRQMRPGSEFLRHLRDTQEKLGTMPVVSYRTPMDLVILPPASSIWDRAENLEYPVILHPMMLTSNTVLNDIERRLVKEYPEKEKPRLPVTGGRGKL
ncbi:MAG: lipase [Verrucomicrobiaceae bacterium]|nr:MAG: lipase [Verrucomicrobiaceae bacterium]